MSGIYHSSDTRAARRARGTCPDCGSAVAPGRKLCAQHLDAHRERNRAHYRRQQEAGVIMPIRTKRIVEAESRRRDELALVAWAVREGVVPTLVQAAAALDYPWPTASRVKQARRRAFGLRPLRKAENRTTIPFPVPAEFLAESEVAS